ncbi:MAG: glycosyltransferase [Verrucomicrobia bacterium]|jgi:glycosyltransferase involved in cell wall biosynthesis|nr:glycosyltransferase [Verrucomicrobiota bacterium]
MTTAPLLPAEPDLDEDIRELSVVIPVYNEEASLPELVRRLLPVLAKEAPDSAEVVFIDDGSTDASWTRIRELQKAHPEVVCGLRHRRNFGKAAALSQGFRAARGKCIITMDADLQDQPEEIPRLLAALSEDVDLVSGWKRRRQDPLDKTLPSKIFNFIARKLSGLPLHDMNCGFKAYRAEVAKGVKLYGELHRFIPILANAEGYRVAEVAVDHQRREHGRSKYGATRMIKGALDLLTTVVLTRYLRRPAHFFGGLGLLVGISGLGILAYLSIGWFLGYKGIGTRPLFFFGILGTLLSAQLVSLGILAELVLLRTVGLEEGRSVQERVG